MTLELASLKDRAAELAAWLQAGETVEITNDGRVLGLLTAPPPAGADGERLIGFARGSVRHVADDFTRPLPDDVWSGGAP